MHDSMTPFSSWNDPEAIDTPIFDSHLVLKIENYLEGPSAIFFYFQILCALVVGWCSMSEVCHVFWLDLCFILHLAPN